ncbi:MAG: FAD-dependent oxidoreductase, partial [Bacillota bacterium]|nr:FAD-dependent oxidoreductase [Bacillota bacterium]
KIEPKEKKVRLSNGSIEDYDKLLVAVGGVPIEPPIPGLDKLKKKFTFQTIGDALSLERALGKKKDKRVLILGGGLIGLKCAEGIGPKAKSITVVDREDHILPSILDAEGAAYVQKAGEAAGINFLLKENAVKFTEKAMETAGGKTIDFDILVLAAGVRANSDLVKEAGGEVGYGIKTNAKNETSLKDIYAAGDCAESRDFVDGQDKVLALLPNAYMGGENAGLNMAGAEHCFTNAIAVNALKFWGQHLITAGQPIGEVYAKVEGDNYKKFFYSEDLLKGFIVIGDVARSGIYTSLIRNATPLSEIDFDLIKEKPQLMAFSSKVRAEELGGKK